MFPPSYHPQPTLVKVAVCVAMLASIATGKPVDKPNTEHVLGDLDYLIQMSGEPKSGTTWLEMVVHGEWALPLHWGVLLAPCFLFECFIG